MPSIDQDPVKQQVAAHWNRRASGFDADFGHSIRTAAERAAWDRILDLVVGGRGTLDALDVGCGTGFLSLELARRGHRVTGIDFAPQMLAEARKKAAAQGVAVRFEEGDAEQLPFAEGSFDLVMTRHVLWTLPHPEAAIDEWIRVLRPAGLVLVSFHVGTEVRHLAEWWGTDVDVDFRFLEMADVVDAMQRAGFSVEAQLERTSYPGEVDTRRGYLLAKRQG